MGRVLNEHNTFVWVLCGALIPFDQWGVSRRSSLQKRFSTIHGDARAGKKQGTSTQSLVAFYRKRTETTLRKKKIIFEFDSRKAIFHGLLLLTLEQFCVDGHLTSNILQYYMYMFIYAKDLYIFI